MTGGWGWIIRESGKGGCDRSEEWPISYEEGGLGDISYEEGGLGDISYEEVG